MNPSGNLSDHKTVIFGSGAGPKFIKVWRYLNEFLVTNGLPFTPIPPIPSVTQVGSPANKSLYSGVLKCLTNLNFIINWSINSWASNSVKVPALRSLSMKISKKVEVLPRDIAAPLFSLTAAKYPKYKNWTASLAFAAGLDISKPYLAAIDFIASKALICSETFSLNWIYSSTEPSLSNDILA